MNECCYIYTIYKHSRLRWGRSMDGLLANLALPRGPIGHGESQNDYKTDLMNRWMEGWIDRGMGAAECTQENKHIRLACESKRVQATEKTWR